MSLKIIKPGLLTTVQDCGRWGYQQFGVIVSGAMDRLALRMANILVGNQEEDAALEISIAGPEILFEDDSLIAITGANLSPLIDNLPIQQDRPLWVSKGSVLSFGSPVKGCRAYLAVAGSFNLPKIMGSHATYLRGNIGGLEGRALKKDDYLYYKAPSEIGLKIITVLKGKVNRAPFVAASWFLISDLQVNTPTEPFIRIVKGTEWELFSKESRKALLEETYIISLQSDRMGFYLEGSPLFLEEKKELISSGVAFGTIQVPPNGQPIVLMAAHQTTGGYPRIAQVISVDLPLLAQVMPGRKIHFKEVTLQEAQRLLIAREKNIEQMKQALLYKIR